MLENLLFWLSVLGTAAVIVAGLLALDRLFKDIDLQQRDE